MTKQFTSADIDTRSGYKRISAEREDLEWSPPEWMARGLQETSSGYGNRLNSGYMIHFDGKRYRVYTTIFSNCGTCWFKAKGEKIIVG